ncbi:putative small membrane protein [Pseudomonas amygdali pv. ciccaronei]|nr:putative small membrane protein [Pseudomonas amygdali pv. ciccaronei]
MCRPRSQGTPECRVPGGVPYGCALPTDPRAALALLGVAILATHIPGRLVTWAGFSFAIGILLFSGSLYALTLTGIGKLGIITPFGGLAFLFGWSMLGLAAWRLGSAP